MITTSSCMLCRCCSILAGGSGCIIQGIAVHNMVIDGYPTILDICVCGNLQPEPIGRTQTWSSKYGTCHMYTLYTRWRRKWVT